MVEKYRTSGELNILGELYERYTHLVYGVSLKYLKDREEGKDAVMAIFEKLIDDLRKHEVTNFKSWLHVTTRNFCLMKLRSSKHKISTSDVELNMEMSLPVHHKEESLEGDLQILEKCIEELNVEQKKSVKLFFIEQKCYQEVVDVTGFEMKKIKSYIQNGKRNLKLCVERKREQD